MKASIRRVPFSRKEAFRKLPLLTILFFSPFIGLMPQSALAAIVIVFSVGLIKPIEFREIMSIRKTEFSWAIVASQE